MFDIKDGWNNIIVIHKESNYIDDDSNFINKFIENKIIPKFKGCEVEGSTLGEWEYEQLKERGVLTYTQFENTK